MKICALIKYPPIQGGVSAHGYWIARTLAERGHRVTVVTNADEVEDDYRIWLPAEDRTLLEPAFANDGRVALVSTSKVNHRPGTHIPDSNPFVSKLSALAVEAVRQSDAEVIFAYYLEPYCIAGLLAARLTGRPLVVQHAGSDRVDLMDDPELSTVYRELLRSADGIIGPVGTLEGFGIPADRVTTPASGFLPRLWTDQTTDAVDLNSLIARLAAEGHPWITNSDPLPDDRATFCLYGKVGETKGSYDLVAALARLREQGRPFNLLLLVGGPERSRLLAAVRRQGLASTTWTLPYLPHWRMPSLLRAVTAVCHLERGFGIAIHRPGSIREALAAGTCLVMSGEIAGKQPFAGDIRSGHNAYVVTDPRDVDGLSTTLARIAEDPGEARAIGAAGAALPVTSGESELGASYEHAFTRVLLSGVRHGPIADPMQQAVSLVRSAMPATVATLSGTLDELVTATAWNHTEPVGVQAYRFGERLVTAIEMTKTRPVVHEASRFELDMLWLSLDLESHTGSPAFPRRGAESLLPMGPVAAADCRPVRSRQLRIRNYRRDLSLVLQQMQGSCRYECDDEAPSVTFVFVKRGSLQSRVMRVNRFTVALLEACDGKTPVDRLVNGLAGRLGVPGDIVMAALRTLLEERMVWV